MTPREAYEQLAKTECQCVRCGECHGSGFVPFFYMGMEESERCVECYGDGIIEVCDRCRELEELEQLINEESEKEPRP